MQAISPAATSYSAPVEPSSATTIQQLPQALPELAPFQLPLYPGGMQIPYTPYPAPMPPALPPHRRKTLFTVLLITALAVLILIGSGIIYYAAVAHPATLQTQATTIVKSLATAQVKASATAYASTPQGIYASATSGSPSVNDAMSDATTSLWSNYTDPHGNCSFVNNSLHITVTRANYEVFCIPTASGFTNMAYQVQMNILQGDAGGCLFYYTGDATGTSSYFFEIFSSGMYALYVKQEGQQYNTLAYNRSSALKAGLKQPNLLTVVAINGNIYLYINKQYVTTVYDTTLSEGNIGLFAASYTTFSTQVAFSNARAWDLP